MKKRDKMLVFIIFLMIICSFSVIFCYFYSKNTIKTQIPNKDKWAARIVISPDGNKALWIYGEILLDSPYDRANLILPEKQNLNKKLLLDLKIERISSVTFPTITKLVYCSPKYKNQYDQVIIKYPNDKLIEIKIPKNEWAVMP